MTFVLEKKPTCFLNRYFFLNSTIFNPADLMNFIPLIGTAIFKIVHIFIPLTNFFPNFVKTLSKNISMLSKSLIRMNNHYSHLNLQVLNIFHSFVPNRLVLNSVCVYLVCFYSNGEEWHLLLNCCVLHLTPAPT